MLAMRSCAFPLGVMFAALLLVSCGGSHDAQSRSLDDLRAEIVKLHAEQGALAERLEGIEAKLRAERAAAAPAAVAPLPPPVIDADRPDLETVRLRPEEGAAEDDPDAPRPVLRVVGDGGSIQGNAASEGGGDDIKKKSKRRVAGKKP